MNKRFKNGLQIGLIILIIIGFIFVGTRDFTEEVVVDNLRFDQEYSNVSSQNVFKYATAIEVYAALNNDAIIFMGYNENIWSGYYADLLNEAAKESGIKEILYYDFYEDRENKNATYQSIVLALGNYLYTLDDGSKEIYAPTLVIVKDGKIIAFDSTTSITKGNINPDEYWTNYRKGIQYNIFLTMFKQYLS